jgi:hypothetical protein
LKNRGGSLIAHVLVWVVLEGELSGREEGREGRKKGGRAG